MVDEHRWGGGITCDLRKEVPACRSVADLGRRDSVDQGQPVARAFLGGSTLRTVHRTSPFSDALRARMQASKESSRRVRSNDLVPKFFDATLSNHLRYPLWVFAVPVVLFAIIPTWILAERGEIFAAVLVVLGYVQAVMLGRVRLAKSLVAQGKVKPEDLG
ncbi:hypothetical protein ABT008_24265 [Micromonospora sp. NPDC002389]|uniref:hypothetical protein n=1 Tax=Micromonospora sp. NPDC002389 TaxID=3154272 RepID=UPI00332E582A